MTYAETDPCPRGCVVPTQHAIKHDRYSTCPGCKPRTVMRGTTVCKHCADLFHHALRDLRIIWPDLRTGVARDRATSTAGGQAVQTSGVSEAGDYWRPHVTRAITDVTEWLEFVAAALAASKVRGLAGVDLAAATPELALAALAYNATPILIKHPEIAEALVGEACRLRDRAHEALSTRLVRRIPLKHPDAKCISLVEYDDPTTPEGFRTERCGGDLVAVMQAGDRSKSSQILCSRFPIQHRVPTTSWGALADAIATAIK